MARTLSDTREDEMESGRLRSATNADAASVKALVFTVLAEYELRSDPEGTDADLDDLEGQYISRGGAFDVVQDADGEIVGSVGLFPVDSTTCELRKMYLKPHARGRGLGKRLLEHALSRARALGFSRVTLETAAVLREAIGLYTKYGFRRAESSHLSNRCDSMYALVLTPHEAGGRVDVSEEKADSSGDS